MKKLILPAVFLLWNLASFAQPATEKISYPDTKKGDVSDNYFGTKVEDPYRWLEDDNSAETKAWVQEQNKVTFDYLGKIPYREDIKNRITIFQTTRAHLPHTGLVKYYFFSKNDGLQPQSVTYYQKGLSGTPQVFIDPNSMNAAGTTAVNFIGFSNDKKYVAYSVAESGSDWQKIYVKDIASNKQLSDKLEWTKFSGAAWYRDGFFYSGYDSPVKGSELSAANKFQKVFYHRLGDPQGNDVVVWEDREHPLRYVGAQTTEDEKFLILTISEGTDGTELWYMDLRNRHAGFKKVFEGFKYNYAVLDNDGENFIVQTNQNAKNYQVVLVNPVKPDVASWKPLIPEKPELLQNVFVSGGKLFTEYLKDATSRISQYDRKGSLERDVVLPGFGTVGGFSGEKDDTTLFFAYTSFNTPATIYQYSLKTGKVCGIQETGSEVQP
jgi:prolyl oligopeptidase